MVAVRVFVDCWNFELGWNSTFPVAKGTPAIRIDWKGLPSMFDE